MSVYGSSVLGSAVRLRLVNTDLLGAADIDSLVMSAILTAYNDGVCRAAGAAGHTVEAVPGAYLVVEGGGKCGCEVTPEYEEDGEDLHLGAVLD